MPRNPTKSPRLKKNVAKRARARFLGLQQFLWDANSFLAQIEGNVADRIGPHDQVFGLVAAVDHAILKLVMVGPRPGMYPELVVYAMDRLTRHFKEVRPGMCPAIPEWLDLAATQFGYTHTTIILRHDGQWVTRARNKLGLLVLDKSQSTRWAKVFKQLTQGGVR